MKVKAASRIANNRCLSIDSWIAFDLEWELESDTQHETSHCLSDTHPHNPFYAFGTFTPPAEKDYRKILTFGYEDNDGNKETLDISDFSNCTNPQKAFLTAIRDRLFQYRYCFSWGSKAVKHMNEHSDKLEGVNGDLVMLDANFRCNHIPSMIKYDRFSGIPYIKNNSGSDGIHATVDIDLLKVFAKPLIKYAIFKNKYKSLRLHEVAIALLGYGKLDKKSGNSIGKMSISERKEYCQHDAHLVAELVKIENGDILKIMQVIANHTDLKLEEVCQKGMTGIWTKILNNAISKKVTLVGFENLSSTLRNLYSSNHQSYSEYRSIENEFEEYEAEEESGDEYDEDYLYNSLNKREVSQEYLTKSDHRIEIDAKKSARKYKGAIVLEPVKGLHHDVYFFDVTSLYPTMIIKYNLSPETVNCSCCKNNPKAKEFYTTELIKDCKHIPKHGYWICQRKTGLFTKILQELTEKRIEYKERGLEVESQAIKAIINSGYGVFGHPYFKYYDPRVAELVTAFGRQTLMAMKNIAADIGFNILGGDTDSLFLNSVRSLEDAKKFISECKFKLGVDVGHEKTFSKLILVGKKHYVGMFTDIDKEPVVKGMEGIKSDRPELIHRIFKQLIDDIKYDNNPIPKLKQALDELDNRSVPPELLAISLVLRKNPEDYEHSCKQSRLGAKLGLQKGDILVYYKSDIEKSVYNPKTKQEILQVIPESDISQDISYAKYKEMLINAVKDILEILGYDIEKDLLAPKKRLLDSSYFKAGVNN